MGSDRSTWLGCVTVGEIEDLRRAAGQAGDLDQVEICDDALECDIRSQLRCVMVIADAEHDAERYAAASAWLSAVRF